MYFANPWGLLGLLSLPAILAIHLYHRRFPPLDIAGLHLWGVETRKESPGRTREKLPWTKTLLLELLAALLVSLLIADPRDSSTTRRSHTVIILDHSASMSAVDPATEQSTRDRCLVWLSEKHKSAARDQLYSILTTGRRPTLIAGPRADWTETEAALKKWEPVATKHDFSPAWDLGAQLASDEAEFFFLTDQLPGEAVSLPERMETVSLGRELNNIAVTAARWLNGEELSEGTLFVRVANLGDREQTVSLTALAGSSQLLTEEQTLTAGGEKSFEWSLPGGLNQITFNADTPADPLAIDNKLILREPKVRRITIAVLLPSTHPAFEPVKRILGVLPNIQLGDPAQADLVIAAAEDEPIAARETWWLGIGPYQLEVADRNAKTVIGPYLIEKTHPLMNEIILGGVVWGGIQEPPTELMPIISTGSSLLFGQWTRSTGPAYCLNIDLNASNLTESPDWPIFWTNLIEQCRLSRPGLRRWNYQIEETVSFQLPTDRLDINEEFLLESDSDTKPLLRTETVEISPRDNVGVYRITDAGQEFDTFAVNFLDREESNLVNLKPGVRRATSPVIATGIHWENPFSWLLVIGILLVLIALLYNWYELRIRQQQTR